MGYDEIKNEILKNIKVYDIVSSYGIKTEKKGDNYWCICPFHEDHNPSMSMPSDGKMYTCFVCHAHGNVFNFVMDYLHVSFLDSMKILADKLGIKTNFKVSSEEKHNSFQKLYDIYDFSTKFYINKLNTKEGVIAQKYLYDRGFTDDVIKEFKIGLSGNGDLFKTLKDKGFSVSDITNSHICNNGDNGIYDMFNNRIMFPLPDLDGNTVGFSGRIYKPNSSDESKYMNSKGSDIFVKGDILYNYKRARTLARGSDTIIVVEGFMDVIALYKIGIYNVVAGMGTAITENQAKLIKNMGHKVILMFDGDSAGENATKGCIDELRKINVSPFIVRLPNNLDPDEYINEFGKEKMQNYLDNPLTLLDYMLSSLKKDADLSNSESVSSYIKNVCKELSLIEDDLVRNLEIKKLSNETGVAIDVINNYIVTKNVNKVIVQKEVKHNKYDMAERNLVYYMINNTDVIKLYKNNRCFIPTDKYRYLVSEIVEFYNTFGYFDTSMFLAKLEDNMELVDAFNEIDTLKLPKEYIFDEIMDYINLLNSKTKEDYLNDLVSKYKSELDINKKIKLIDEINKLRSE